MAQNNKADDRRSAVGPPEKIYKGITLFDYLQNCRPPIDKKIVDIVVATTKVPRGLKEDAAQEIYMIWNTIKPDIKKYKPGQIASYAYRVGFNAALKLRRELASAVRLPGSAFRKRKDGSSYVTPGVLSEALDWNELESWFDTNDGAKPSELANQNSATLLPDAEEVSEVDEESGGLDIDEEIRRGRLAALEKNANRISRRQYKIMAQLIAGESFEDIQAKTGFKKGLVLREISIAAGILGPDVMSTLTEKTE